MLPARSPPGPPRMQRRSMTTVATSKPSSPRSKQGSPQTIFTVGCRSSTPGWRSPPRRCSSGSRSPRRHGCRESVPTSASTRSRPRGSPSASSASTSAVAWVRSPRSAKRRQGLFPSIRRMRSARSRLARRRSVPSIAASWRRCAGCAIQPSRPRPGRRCSSRSGSGTSSRRSRRRCRRRSESRRLHPCRPQPCLGCRRRRASGWRCFGSGCSSAWPSSARRWNGKTRPRRAWPVRRSQRG